MLVFFLFPQGTLSRNIFKEWSECFIFWILMCLTMPSFLPRCTDKSAWLSPYGHSPVHAGLGNVAPLFSSINLADEAYKDSLISSPLWKYLLLILMLPFGISFVSATQGFPWHVCKCTISINIHALHSEGALSIWRSKLSHISFYCFIYGCLPFTCLVSPLPFPSEKTLLET